MRVIDLNTWQTIILDVLIWAVFHLSIGSTSAKIPLDRLDPGRPIFSTFGWEQGGRIYQKLFRVRAWKGLLPNGSGLYKEGYSIHRLTRTDRATLARWLKETVRAETCHWMMILPGFLFFFWNSPLVGWLMVAYAFLNNLPVIVVQRFNRPRLRRMLAIRARQEGAAAPKVSAAV
jgi:glycosyl-4,4'-diaponeurosporenoate acyltransferase